jgi:hypothetical protein
MAVLIDGKWSLLLFGVIGDFHNSGRVLTVKWIFLQTKRKSSAARWRAVFENHSEPKNASAAAPC